MDFTLLHSWYDQYKDGYEPTTIRGELYPDSTKSRYENTDANMNIRCSLDSGIQKGDMVIASNDNRVYLLDWEVYAETNNRPSRALRCNMLLTIKRFVDEVTDDRGYLIQEAGVQTIVDALPVNAYRYDGRPEYSVSSGTPGIAPNALTLMTVQYNEQTMHIHDNDEFIWANDTYRVIDVSRVGLDVNETRGCLTLRCQKKAGGLHYKS